MRSEKKYHVTALGEVILKTDHEKAAYIKAKRFAKENEATVTVEKRVTVFMVDKFGRESGSL